VAFFRGAAYHLGLLRRPEGHSLYPSFMGYCPQPRYRRHMSWWVLCHEVTPVHTALRNCTRDEGRPFEFGSQVLISSHRKLLSAKVTVVNVAEKSRHDLDRRD
jgi:hypothetical protein